MVGSSDSGFVVGEEALEQAGRNPVNTIFSAKRLLGSRQNDLEIQKDIWRWPYTVEPESDKIRFELEHKKGKVNNVSPEEICSMILGTLKRAAEIFLGEKVRWVSSESKA